MPYINGKRGSKLSADTSILHLIDSIDIEHIFPQSLYASDFDNENKDKIGNLTFWGYGDNRSVKNASFEEKREKYLESSVHLNNHLGSYTKWSNDEFEERQNFILEFASEVFQIK